MFQSHCFQIGILENTFITLNRTLNLGKTIVFYKIYLLLFFFLSIREVIFFSPLGKLLIPRNMFFGKVLRCLFYFGPIVDFSPASRMYLCIALVKSWSLPFLVGYSSVVQSMGFRRVRMWLEIYLPLARSATSINLLYIDEAFASWSTQCES